MSPIAVVVINSKMLVFDLRLFCADFFCVCVEILQLKLVFLKRIFNMQAICLLQKTPLPLINTNHNKLDRAEKENVPFVDGKPNY